MKRIFRIFISLAFLLGLSLSPQLVVAQTSLEDAIRQFDSDNTKGYLQPFIDSFGNNLNSGIYRGTKIQTFGLNIQIGLVGMITQIPDEDRTEIGKRFRYPFYSRCTACPGYSHFEWRL